jgi:hypothetical protein
MEDWEETKSEREIRRNEKRKNGTEERNRERERERTKEHMNRRKKKEKWRKKNAQIMHSGGVRQAEGANSAAKKNNSCPCRKSKPDPPVAKQSITNRPPFGAFEFTNGYYRRTTCHAMLSARHVPTTAF